MNLTVIKAINIELHFENNNDKKEILRCYERNYKVGKKDK